MNPQIAIPVNSALRCFLFSMGLRFFSKVGNSAISELIVRIQQQRIHPTLAFMLSFIILILLGTFFLLLPLSTPYSISTIDALFTATSAVCVTGLIAVDEIIHPEAEYAHQMANRLTIGGSLKTLVLDSSYEIIEPELPEGLRDKTVEEVGFREEYDISVVTVMQQKSAETYWGSNGPTRR